MFHEVTNLCFLHFVWVHFTDTDLDCVTTVLFLCFYLCYLTPIELDNSAGLEFAPFVPEVGAANFVAEYAGATGETISFESGC